MIDHKRYLILDLSKLCLKGLIYTLLNLKSTYKLVIHSCTLYKIRFFLAGVNDLWLSTTLDQNSALLIGLWQNHEVYVGEQEAFYIYNTFVIPKTPFFIQFWLFRHIKIYHGLQNQMFSKTYTD